MSVRRAALAATMLLALFVAIETPRAASSAGPDAMTQGEPPVPQPTAVRRKRRKPKATATPVAAAATAPATGGTPAATRTVAAAPAGTQPPATTATAPAPTPTPAPGRIQVTVTLLAAGGKKTPAPNAVVWLPGSTFPKAPPRGRMASQKKSFQPHVVAVSEGAAVDFPNLDAIHHNVFSLSEKAKFDLGLYKNGASKPMAFPASGVVRVFCNIHPQMAGYVLVVDGKAYAVTNADGGAEITDVPPGKHAVKVWDEKGGEWTGTAEVKPEKTAAISVTLDASAWKETPHTRKDGTKYPPPDDDENRY